jgi:hypothetical protein
LKASRRKYIKALSLIDEVLTETIFPKIVEANYAKEALDNLETKFKRIDKV